MTERIDKPTFAFLAFVPIGSGLLAAYLVWATSPITGWSPTIIGAVAAILAWLWIIRRAVDVLFPGIQGNSDVTLKNDIPPPTTRIVTIEKGEFPRGDFIDLPVEEERLEILAHGLLKGRGFTEGEWTGSQAPFSRGEFVRLRAELIERGFMRWVNPRAHAQGVEVTRGGWSLFESLIDVDDLLPHGGDRHHDAGVIRRK